MEYHAPGSYSYRKETALMLTVRNLHKIYGKYHALSGLDMNVGYGALYGFVGPNGAGKTTTLKIMTGLLGAEEGSVTINGKDALRDLGELKGMIGYVPDFFGVYDNLAMERSGDPHYGDDKYGEKDYEAPGQDPDGWCWRKHWLCAPSRIHMPGPDRGVLSLIELFMREKRMVRLPEMDAPSGSMLALVSGFLRAKSILKSEEKMVLLQNDAATIFCYNGLDRSKGR